MSKEIVAQRVAHTLGPWKVVRVDYSKKEDASFEIISGGGDLVAQTIMRELATEADVLARDAANSRLIAAAPELLAALKAADEGSMQSTATGKHYIDSAALLAIRAAIEKAEGGK